MTDVYYDAGGSGSNTSPYDTAAKAATTLAAALGAVGATNDIIYALSTSSQAISTSTFTASATYATAENPQRLYSVSSLGTPDTLTFGAKLTQVTTGDDFTISGYWDINGLDFDLSLSTAVGQLSLGVSGIAANIKLTNCKFTSATYSLSVNFMNLGVASGNSSINQSIILKNFTFYSNGTAVPFVVGSGYFELDNLILSGTAPTTIFKFVRGTSVVTLKNSDLTGNAWTNLLNVTATTTTFYFTIQNCKLPSSYTLYTGAISSDLSTITLINASSGDINYQYAKYCLAGSIITIDSVYASTSPMQVGGVSVSDIFTSTASAGRSNTLSREYFIVEVADNTSVTPFVEFLVQTSGAAALNNNEVYITAETVTVDGTTQGSQVTSHPGALATPSNCSAGTTAYTGDGYATERTHRVVTAAITTRQSGQVKITVHLAKASTAIYIGRVGVV
jgi:hypothetical protein